MKHTITAKREEGFHFLPFFMFPKHSTRNNLKKEDSTHFYINLQGKKARQS